MQDNADLLQLVLAAIRDPAASNGKTKNPARRPGRIVKAEYILDWQWSDAIAIWRPRRSSK